MIRRVLTRVNQLRRWRKRQPYSGSALHLTHSPGSGWIVGKPEVIRNSCPKIPWLLKNSIRKNALKNRRARMPYK